MPKTKPNKNRSYTARHSQDMMDLAIEALKNKTISSYEAEKCFGIPRRTLLDKLHNKHPKNVGCPTKLTEQEEANIVKVLIAAAEYGSPLTLLDLRIVVQRYLSSNGKLSIFDNKLPGKKWAYSFLKRNKSKLTHRIIQNIKRSRAEKTEEEMNEYFNNLKSSIEDVPIDNILNYDETNLTDNPGVQKCLFKRGVKYPERIMNYTKGAISIMFAITAGGECLAPYVVYKAEHLYTQWTINGPKGSRYNRSKSGWFDSTLFEDWFETMIVPWAKSKTGPKVLIGDNLASHINHKIVTYCEQNDIRFVFLPPNSSHITQPLDVCYFGPLKKLWREILLNYKIKNPREATVHKGHFPDLLKILIEQLNEKKKNIISAFKSTGIVPFNPDKVISKLPSQSTSTMAYSIDNALLDWLKETRKADPDKKKRNKKLYVPPGKSVGTTDFKDLNNTVLKKYNRQRKGKSNTVHLISGATLQQPLLMLKNHDSLKNLCLKRINQLLVQYGHLTQASNVHNFSNNLKNDEANIAFVHDLPECLKTIQPKITITSDITIKPGLSQKLQQHKLRNINKKETKCIIRRNALNMKLLPIKKETLADKSKVQKDITQNIEELEKNTALDNKKPKEKNRKRTAIEAKVKTYKKLVRKKRFISESSSSSDIDISIADTDSEYETLEDILKTEYEEQENKNSNKDMELTEDTLKVESWILAKFTSKKSIKHYVGRVISLKDGVPEVKFVRKKKETKFDRGFVFTYPNVDDIYKIHHLDDVIMVLPQPNISRRGQIIFNIDLSNYNVQ